MYNFNAHTEKSRAEMLEKIGINSIEDLFSQIPQKARMVDLPLDKPKNEIDTVKIIKKLANKNRTDYLNFMGGGAYHRFIPACISEISSRFEFNTAYTPYQAEISQGTLQMIYEFQTHICNLTGMDVCNASVYDGATACAEAVLMAVRTTKRNKIIISEALNPEYKAVIETYCHAQNIEIEYLPITKCGFEADFSSLEEKISTKEYAGFLFQNPNYYGTIENINKTSVFEETKSLLIEYVDLISLAVLKKPSEMGVNITVGDTQSLGNPLNFGGPYCGFIACVDSLKRQMAGRIIGRTIDSKGEQAFCLTLQAREQHIRREKATSNICSNQSLSALNTAVYLSVMGKSGIEQVAYLSAKNARTLADGLKNKNIKILNKNFFNEFVIEVDNSDEFLKNLKNNGILGGIKIDETRILVCTTEMNSNEDIKKYIDFA